MQMKNEKLAQTKSGTIHYLNLLPSERFQHLRDGRSVQRCELQHKHVLRKSLVSQTLLPEAKLNKSRLFSSFWSHVPFHEMGGSCKKFFTRQNTAKQGLILPVNVLWIIQLMLKQITVISHWLNCLTESTTSWTQVGKKGRDPSPVVTYSLRLKTKSFDLR